MRLLLLLLMLGGFSQITAQESLFFKAMKLNDYEKIDGALDKRIELCIIEDQNLYHKKDALQKISKWVEKINIKSIKEVHTGESNDKKSHYKVARVSTDDGQYRVFVYVHLAKNRELIKKIQIDRF